GRGVDLRRGADAGAAAGVRRHGGAIRRRPAQPRGPHPEPVRPGLLGDHRVRPAAAPAAGALVARPRAAHAAACGRVARRAGRRPGEAMSQGQSGDKTEKPTPQKLRKAREEGQVARSREVGTAVGMAACVLAVLWLAPGWLDDFRQLFMLAMPGAGQGGLNDAASRLFPATLLLVGRMLLPLAA